MNAAIPRTRKIMAMGMSVICIMFKRASFTFAHKET
jgi:hypothetical protein